MLVSQRGLLRPSYSAKEVEEFAQRSHDGGFVDYERQD